MHEIERAVAAIRRADGLLITAGAGIGVDSGLPDFRGSEGFWKAYPALAKSGIHFQDIASPSAFSRNPRQAWGFYGHRLNLYRDTRPNEGFAILQRLAGNLQNSCFVFTSNVDGQFQRAGFDPERVYEIHGSIHYLQCTQACGAEIWPADDFVPVIDEDCCELLSALPSCPQCGALARPNILMFGDWSWQDSRIRQQGFRLHAWQQKVCAPVTIEIGAGKDIPTVRRFSERSPGQLIRINPRDDKVPEGGVSIRLGGLNALLAIEQSLWGDAR